MSWFYYFFQYFCMSKNLNDMEEKIKINKICITKREQLYIKINLKAKWQLNYVLKRGKPLKINKEYVRQNGVTCTDHPTRNNNKIKWKDKLYETLILRHYTSRRVQGVNWLEEMELGIWRWQGVWVPRAEDQQELHRHNSVE